MANNPKESSNGFGGCVAILPVLQDTTGEIRPIESTIRLSTYRKFLTAPTLAAMDRVSASNLEVAWCTRIGSEDQHYTSESSLNASVACAHSLQPEGIDTAL